MPHPFKTRDDTSLAEPAEERISQLAPQPALLPWLTLESCLWAVLFILALTLRLWHLGAYPLSNAEAEQSLVAFHLYRGNLPLSTYYSPLLLSLNALAFLLFSPADFSARLAPLLLGSGLVLLPLTLRRRLGPVVTLLAAALLAISPTAIFLSRTLNSEIGVAAASLMIVAGFFNWVEEADRRWLWLLAGGLALLLAAGPMAYSVLLVFALIVLIRLPAFKALWSQAFSRQAVPSQPVAEPVELAALAEVAVQAPAASSSDHPLPAPTDPAGEASAGPGFSLDPRLRQAGLFFLAALFLLSTTALFNLPGLSRLGGLFLDWLGRFSLHAQPEAGFNAVFLLTIYEPLLVLVGLIGLAYAILRGTLLDLVFSLWFVGLLVVDTLMGGRPTGNVVLPLVPLAFLAALALAELVESIRRQATWGNEGLLLATGLVIAVFAYISLTGWLLRTCGPDERMCQLAWLQTVAALGLFVIIVIFFWLISEPGAALRGAALVGVAVGLLAAVNIGWRLNYSPLLDLAYQPLAGIPAGEGLPLLADTLTLQSVERSGDQTTLDVTVVGPVGSALAWRLRNYNDLSYVNSLAEAQPTTAVITPANIKELAQGQGYVGQDFSLDAIWSPTSLAGDTKKLLHWLLFRQADELPLGNKVILWLRVEPS